MRQENNHPYGNWLLLLWKRELKRAGTWLLPVLSVLILWIFQSAVFSGTDNLRFGVLDGGTRYGEEIIADLIAEADPYQVVLCSSREELIQKVSAGSLDCGFVLLPELDAITGIETLGDTVEYVNTASTQKGEVLKEKVTASVLKTAAKVMLANFAEDPEVFEDAGEDVSTALLASFEAYLGSDDLITVNFETVQGDGSSTAGLEERILTASDRLMALCSMLLFFGALLFGRVRFDGQNRAIRSSLRGTDRAVWSVLSVFSPVSILSVFLVFIWILAHPLWGLTLSSVGLLYGAVLLLLEAPLVTIWTSLYSACFRRDRTYLAGLIIVMLLGVVSCRILIPEAELIAGIRLIRWIFPENWISELFVV